MFLNYKTNNASSSHNIAGQCKFLLEDFWVYYTIPKKGYHVLDNVNRNHLSFSTGNGLKFTDHPALQRT